MFEETPNIWVIIIQLNANYINPKILNYPRAFVQIMHSELFFRILGRGHEI